MIVNFRLSPASVILILVFSLQLFLYSQLPERRRDAGWPTIVMQNWHEYGYWQLSGQLVANPGGFEASEEKFIYPGHRPAFLIPPYLLKELPGKLFGGGLVYDFTVLAVTCAALLWFLGTGLRGILITSTVCLAPGILACVAMVDTISTPSLLGVAAMVFVGGALSREDVKSSTRGVALLVLICYMVLNWCTLFPLGIAAVYVLCKRQEWKKAAVFFAVAFGIGLAVLAVSLHSRQTTTSHFSDFWNTYLWGPLGYDRSGMSFGKAALRILAVNVIGWLPLACAGLVLFFTNGPGQKWHRAAWPLLAALAAVFALRNYNAHHPWPIVPQIGLGLVFALDLLIAPKKDDLVIHRRWVAGTAVALAAGYLVGWCALDEFNSRDVNALRALVVNHTPRHALIVVADGLMPGGVKNLKPFNEEFDRKLVALEEWSQQSDNATNREVFLLAHTSTVPGAPMVGQSQIRPTWADKVMVPLFDFYRKYISRRAPGNRKQYFDGYQLYKL